MARGGGHSHASRSRSHASRSHSHGAGSHGSSLHNNHRKTTRTLFTSSKRRVNHHTYSSGVISGGSSGGAVVTYTDDCTPTCVKEDLMKGLIGVLVAIFVLSDVFVVLACTLQIYTGKLCNNIVSVPLGKLAVCDPGYERDAFFRRVDSVNAYVFTPNATELYTNEEQQLFFEEEVTIGPDRYYLYVTPDEVDMFSVDVKASKPVQVGMLASYEMKDYSRSGFDEDATWLLGKDVTDQSFETSPNEQKKTNYRRHHFLVINLHNEKVELKLKGHIKGSFPVPNKKRAWDFCDSRCNLKLPKLPVDNPIILLENTGDNKKLDANVTLFLDPKIESGMLAIFIVFPLIIGILMITTAILACNVSCAISRDDVDKIAQSETTATTTEMAAYSATTPGPNMAYVSGSGPQLTPPYVLGANPGVPPYVPGVNPGVPPYVPGVDPEIAPPYVPGVDMPPQMAPQMTPVDPNNPYGSPLTV